MSNDAPAMPTGQKLSDYKLIFPTDWDDYRHSATRSTKSGTAMLGL